MITLSRAELLRVLRWDEGVVRAVLSTTVSRERWRKGGKGGKGGRRMKREGFKVFSLPFPSRDISVIGCLQNNVIKKVTVVGGGVRVSGDG